MTIEEAPGRRSPLAAAGPPKPGLSVDELLRCLESTPAPADELDALERGAAEIIASDLVHRLVPYARRLAALDYANHPWAALPAGVAICAVDRDRGRHVLAAARAHFDDTDNALGLSWACFLEGLEDLGEGNLDGAERWWERSLALDAEGPVSGFGGVHLCLAAYVRGDLKRARFIAERSMYEARRRGDARVEAISSVYLALFQWWTGDFERAGAAARTGQEALRRIPDPMDRYEASLIEAALATVAYTEQEYETGEALFDLALEYAEQIQNEWYTAIVLTIRAEVSARLNPERSLRDACAAMDYFERVNELWWSRWALAAYSVAQHEKGELSASVAAAEEMLRTVENPLERGRGLLELGTCLSSLGRHADAVVALRESIDRLGPCDAQFLTARAYLQLARIDSGNRERLVRRARAIARPHQAHVAWRMLLHGAPVRITLLGRPEVCVEGAPVVFRTRYEVELVALLALAGPEGRTREAVIAALWPDIDPEKAANRLNVTVSMVRDALNPATRIVTSPSRLHLELESGECDVCDALAVTPSAAPTVQSAAVARLERPFLGGDSYSEWVIAAQHSLDAFRTTLELR